MRHRIARSKGDGDAALRGLQRRAGPAARRFPLQCAGPSSNASAKQ